jgi:hypothetical protein
MQIQRNCATEANYLMGNLESEACFEGRERTRVRKEAGNEETCQRRGILVFPIPHFAEGIA